MKLSQINQNSLIIFCLIITVLFTVNSLHADYPLPFHSEEYDHLILAKESTQEKIELGLNWEINFSVMLAVINALMLNNLNKFLILIPLISGLILALSSFILGRFLFKSSLAGILFGVFALMIPSSPSIMGLMFATPNSLALSLIPLLLYLFLKGTAHKKTAFLFMILFALTTIIHPAFTLILIPLIAVYLILNPKLFKKNQLKIAIAVILLLILMPFFASRIGTEVSLTHQSLTEITKNAEKVLIWKSITQYSPKFFLADFIGYYLTALAGIGTGLIILMRLLIEFKRKKSMHSLMEKEFIVSKHQIILPIAVIILSFLYLHFNLNDYTFLVPYERMFLVLMLFLLLNAAAGTYLIWKILANKISRQTLKPFSIVFIVLILFFLLTVPFSHKTELYKNIESTGVSSLDWIKENTEKDSSFIAVPKNSLTIKFFTERNIFASPPTRAGLADPFKLEVFSIQNCDKKNEIIKETKAGYIFEDKEIECNSFNKIYDKKDYKIYKVIN